MMDYFAVSTNKPKNVKKIHIPKNLPREKTRKNQLLVEFLLSKNQADHQMFEFTAFRCVDSSRYCIIKTIKEED